MRSAGTVCVSPSMPPAPSLPDSRWHALLLLLALVLAGCGAAAEERPALRPGTAGAGGDLLPDRLSATGLFAPGEPERLADDVQPYTPRFPLWTDGAEKRRFLALPAGTSIDTSDPDRWVFPVGTRLWKEFAIAGRPVETRYLLRRPDGDWSFATYRWDADGRDATRAPEAGVPHAAESAPGVPYDIPSQSDCRACHDSGLGPVLGYSRVQLEPGAAASDTEARALGYLHGNCAHCHNPRSPLASLDLDFEAREPGSARDAERVRATLVGVLTRGTAGTRLVPGHPDASVLVRRVRSTSPLDRMPPRGTRLVDADGAELLATWVRALEAPAPSTTSR